MRYSSLFFLHFFKSCNLLLVLTKALFAEKRAIEGFLAMSPDTCPARRMLAHQAGIFLIDLVSAFLCWVILILVRILNCSIFCYQTEPNIDLSRRVRNGVRVRTKRKFAKAS
jgi:hypothetical protein